MRVCFVCLGNICRSPAAKAVFTHLAAQAGVDVEVDAAGTADYHLGSRPHRSTIAEAQLRGIAIEHRGQQFSAADFDRYDLVVAMDSANEADLLALAPDAGSRGKVVRLGAFDEGADPGDPSTIQDVTDPWGHGPEVFAEMYDHLESALAGLLRRIEDGSPPMAHVKMRA